MMGHGSPRLQDGQGQSQGQDGQSSTRSQDSDLDSQTRRLVAQVQASLEEGHRLVPTPGGVATAVPTMLDTPEGSGARAMLPQEYHVYTAEQAPPTAGSTHAHAHGGGGSQDEAQSNRVNKLSGHTVTQAQTGSDEQYVQQQRRERLQQHQQQQMEMTDVPQQNIVHDYSRTGPNASLSSSVARQQSMYVSRQQQQQQQQQRGVQYERDMEVSSQRHPTHHVEGKHHWALRREEGQTSRTEWSGEMLQGRSSYHQSDRRMHRCEGGRPQDHYPAPTPPRTAGPGGTAPTLLQRRISRSEFVHMYSSDDRYPHAPPPPPPNQSTGATRHPESSPGGAPEVLPEKVDSPISYVSEWLRSSTVWGGEGGYGTPTTADMERDSSRFVYPPPSKLLTDSTPRQHHEEVCISHQDEDSNVIRSFLHEQQQQQQQQVKDSQHDPRAAVQLTQEERSDNTGYDKMETTVDRNKDTSYPQRQFMQDEMSQREQHSGITGLSQEQFFEPLTHDRPSGEIHPSSKKEQTLLMTPQITLEQCEPMMTQQLEGAGGGSPSPMKGEGDTQQLPVRNLKISSPKSTHAARRASSPVVSKPAVPFFWHFHPKQTSGTTTKSSYTLSVKEQVLRRFSDSNIPMEPEDLRIKPAIRSKSTGDSTSYEEECLASEKQTDSNLLSVAACKTAAAAAAKEQQAQGSDDKNIIKKRLKLKTYLQNRYEADKEEAPSAGVASEQQTRMSTASVSPEPESQSRMSVSQTSSGSQRSMSLQSDSERKITKIANVHVSGSLDEGLLRGGRRQHDSPEKTHLTRAIESWNLPHPITIKVEPVSPFPSEDDPETPGSVFTPGINVPATPTSFLSPGAPTGCSRQIFSFNVPTSREMSPPNQRPPPRRPLMMAASMYPRHQSSSLGSLAEKSSLPPPPASPSPCSHASLPITHHHHHHDQRHYSDTVIYTEHKPSLLVRREDDKPKDQPVDMRRSPPGSGSRKQPPPPLQLASMSTFSQMEDQPMPSPGPMLPPPRAEQQQQQQQHISEFLAASAPPAGLRSPAFPFSTLPSHLHSHPGSAGFHHPMLSPGHVTHHMTWSAPPSAALLPQQSPRHLPAGAAVTPVSGAAGASGGIDVPPPQSLGGDSAQRMLQVQAAGAGAMSHPPHSSSQPSPP